jgi:hypothetical protein
MRKAAIIVTACTLLFQISCGQDKQLKAIKQFKRVVIVDINTNVIIPWAGEEKDQDTTASDLKAFGKLVGSKKIESSASKAESLLNQTTKSTIDSIGKTIERDLIASQAFQLVPYDSIDKTRIPRDVTPIQRATEDRAHPAGYDMFDPSKKNITATCEALGLDAIVIVKTDYKRVVSFGNEVNSGTMFITAKMEISIYDRSGKRIWSNSATKDSSDTFAVLNGIYNPEKLDKAVISATENAGRHLFNDLRKRINKVK